MNKLQAAVTAQNRVNRVANEASIKLTAAFASFVGKKIFKADGGLTEQVKKQIDFEQIFSSCRHWVYRLSSSVSFGIDTSEPVSDWACLYKEAFVFVGNLDGSVLMSVCKEPLNLRTDYTVEEIQVARDLVYQKELELSKARDALCNFGQFDN